MSKVLCLIHNDRHIGAAAKGTTAGLLRRQFALMTELGIAGGWRLEQLGHRPGAGETTHAWPRRLRHVPHRLQVRLRARACPGGWLPARHGRDCPRGRADGGVSVTAHTRSK